MVEIRILENIEISNLSDLISNYAFKPYSNYFKLSPEMSTNYFSYEIQNTVDTKENYIIGLIEKKTYRAFCVLKKLELDS